MLIIKFAYPYLRAIRRVLIPEQTNKWAVNRNCISGQYFFFSFSKSATCCGLYGTGMKIQGGPKVGKKTVPLQA